MEEYIILHFLKIEHILWNILKHLLHFLLAAGIAYLNA